MSALSAETRARHIALLRQVADLAEQHDLPVPDIDAPVSDTARACLDLHEPNQDSGPRWAHLLELGAGETRIWPKVWVAYWETSEVELASFCVDTAEAERLAAEDGAA